jgi:hypothetical protein
MAIDFLPLRKNDYSQKRCCRREIEFIPTIAMFARRVLAAVNDIPPGLLRVGRQSIVPRYTNRAFSSASANCKTLDSKSSSGGNSKMTAGMAPQFDLGTPESVESWEKAKAGVKVPTDGITFRVFEASLRKTDAADGKVDFAVRL